VFSYEIICYIALDRTMMAVPVTVGPTFQPGVAVPLFKTNANGYMPYSVAPDGRFLINTLSNPESVSSPITVLVDW